MDDPSVPYSLGDRPAGPVTSFSVVMPSFQQGRFIAQALDSLIDQQYPALEIIVRDGGSTDGTVDILRRYGDRIRWVSEPDGGQSDALAKGFATAGGQWLAWLNSDDLHINGALWRVHDAITAQPEAQVVIGGGNYVDADGGPLRPYPTIAAGPGVDVARELFEKGYVAQPSVFFRRDVYDAVGGVDAGLRFVMDYDLWVRFARRGARFASVPAELSSNRWHESAKTASNLLPLLAEVVAVQTREYGTVSPYFVQAVSDHLYSILHSRHRGDRSHLFYRTLYFKAAWALLNCHRPLVACTGLLTRFPAKSGPIVGDYITLPGAVKLVGQAITRRMRPGTRTTL
jgi:glycosyltransferase involved in cell wall biosynthesis